MAATLGDLIQQVEHRLASSQVPEPALEARWLLREVLELSFVDLVLLASQPVTTSRYRRVMAACERRCHREPLAFITGSRSFWSLDFHVTPDVLVPRPETELLVETAITLFGTPDDLEPRGLDMGTGSGVLAVVLARELHARMVAVDRSPAALKVARKNVLHHGLADRVALVAGDLFAALRPGSGYDLVISNPPYIATAEYALLEPEIRRWEPAGALLAGDDGLACIRTLVRESRHYLRPGGWLLLEIGAGQGAAVERLMREHGYARVVVQQDYGHRDRVVRGCWPGGTSR